MSENTLIGGRPSSPLGLWGLVPLVFPELQGPLPREDGSQLFLRIDDGPDAVVQIRLVERSIVTVDPGTAEAISRTAFCMPALGGPSCVVTAFHVVPSRLRRTTISQHLILQHRDQEHNGNVEGSPARAVLQTARNLWGLPGSRLYTGQSFAGTNSKNGRGCQQIHSGCML